MDDLISRSALLAEIKRIGGQPFSDWDTMGVLALAERIPAVDAVAVVRCIDCRYSKTCNRTIKLIPRQAQIGYLRCVVHSCEYGERRGDYE